MKPVLYVALPSDDGDPLLVVEERGDRMEILSHGGPFPAGSSCIAFAPATMVAHFHLALPARNDTEAARAALYAIEDEIAEPIEDVHLVLGPRTRGDSRRHVYAVNRAVLDAWLAQLSAAGLNPGRIIPEQCLFDAAEQQTGLGSSSILSAGERIFAVDADLPAEARGALGLETEPPGQPAGQHLIRLAERAASRPTVNLRTSAFAPAKKQETGYRSWRVAAGLAIAATSIWTGNVILETRNYNFAVRQMERQAGERYATLFPGAAIPADLDRATRDMLTGTAPQGGFGFRDAAAYFYEVAAAAPGFRIIALTYQQDQKAASADFIVPQPDMLDLARSYLEAEGLAVDVRLDPDTDGPITGTIQIGAMQ